MAKNKKRKHQKQQQKRAEKASFKKKIEKRSNAAVLKYLRGGRRIQVQNLKAEAKSGGLALDQVVSFAHCDGVGECCKNRPIHVEPTDVYRVLHNDRAKKKFGFTSTIDLYGTDEKPGPLVYWTEKTSFMPFCAVHRIDLAKAIPEGLEKPGLDVGKEDQVCPFLEFKEDGTPECILGDDKFTQCSSDPIIRTGRVNHKRRLAGWEYSLIDQPCMGCRQAAEDKERNIIVSEWLQNKGMEDRYIESDLFHGFLLKMRDLIKQHQDQREFLWKMVTSILFDWDRFGVEVLQYTQEELKRNGPSSPKEIFLAANELMEGIINGPTDVADRGEPSRDGVDEAQGQANDS